ncbi:MAG: hypothetical protein WBD31_17070 [Rubripirellula sp.]
MVRNRTRAVGLVAAVSAIMAFGCDVADDHDGQSEGNWGLISAKVVSVSEIDRLASGEPVFYQGSNDQWHYFRVGSVGYYRLRRSEVSIPTHGFEGDGTASLGMVFMTLTVDGERLHAAELPTGTMGNPRRPQTFTLSDDTSAANPKQGNLETRKLK